MTAAISAGRTLCVALVGSLALAAGCQAQALADPVSPVIATPSAGGWANSATPSFSGTTTDEVDPLTLRIYAGTSAEGSALQTLQTLLAPVAGVWALAPETPLAPGTYTAVAEQAPAEAEATVSAPVTFTVDTQPPAPTITAPAYGAVISQGIPAFRGTAGEAPGDAATVQLDVYADGPGRTETLVESLRPLGVVAGAWTSGKLGSSLPDGLYTAYVRQSDAAGNVGTSEPLTFAVELRVPARGETPEAAPAVTAPTPAATAPTGPSAPQWLAPFPVVRIAGFETPAGARISLLTVQAPVGARVTVTCRGAGCPVRSEGVFAGSGRHPLATGMQVIAFRRFERALKAGVTLEIRVSRPGLIGKYVRFTIRHGKLPTRQDRCLDPAAGTPISCPVS